MRPRFITLTPQEELTLREGQQHGPQFQFRDRCRCLILSHQGQTVNWLMAHFKVSRLTIYNWFNAWEEQGLRGLYNRAGQGRKPILTDEDKPTIIQQVQQHRQQLKAALPPLRADLHRDFSQKTLERFLKSITGVGDVSAGA